LECTYVKAVTGAVQMLVWWWWWWWWLPIVFTSRPCNELCEYW